MVFSQKRLLPPEAAPGQSDDPDRWTAQSQAPSREPEPGVEGGLAVHHLQPPFDRSHDSRVASQNQVAQFMWYQVASLNRHRCPTRRWTRVSGLL